MGQTKTMKAAVVRAFGKPLVIEELPVPEPKANEILVKMESTGICHTDLHAIEGDWPIKPSPPFIPGHEGVGYVAAAGKDVKQVREGDLVGTPWLYSACGYCEHCLAGWETLCERQQNGVAVDVDDSKLRLARTLGASITINALTSDPVVSVKREIGGAHGVPVTAV